MRLHDTLTRSLRDLPAPPGPIRMYVCGSTVYQRVHVGNSRPFVIAMWLRSWLRLGGYEVTLVHNITDVDDKVYAEALRQGIGSRELSARATEWFLDDTDHLGLGQARSRAAARRSRSPRSSRSSRSSSRATTPTSRTATCTSPCRRRRTTAGCPVRGSRTWRRRRRARSSATRATSRCGSRRKSARTPPGTRRGGRVAPAGTSSALRWPRSSSATSSRSTEAEPTCGSRTTRTSSPSPRPSATRSRGSGCTTACSSWPRRRCRSRSGTS